MNSKLAPVHNRSKKIPENKLLYLLYFILSFFYTVNPIINLVSVPCLVGGMSMRYFGINVPARFVPSAEWGTILATWSHRKKSCFTKSKLDKVRVILHVAIYSDIS
jgi:hypothetical protein